MIKCKNVYLFLTIGLASTFYHISPFALAFTLDLFARLIEGSGIVDFEYLTIETCVKMKLTQLWIYWICRQRRQSNLNCWSDSFVVTWLFRFVKLFTNISISVSTAVKFNGKFNQSRTFLQCHWLEARALFHQYTHYSGIAVALPIGAHRSLAKRYQSWRRQTFYYARSL